VGKIGFNTAGVGVCLNAIRAKSCDSSKLPIHLALRVCLESTSVENALQTLSSLGGVASAQHILLADSKTALGLELSPLGDVHLKKDEFGMVTHTNHFLKNRYTDEIPWIPGSSIRLDRVRQLARDLARSGIKGEKITPALLRGRIFSDMENAPKSICAQEDLSSHRTVRSCSLFNIVMDLGLPNPSAEVVMIQPGAGMEDSVVTMPWV
jgi:isopenicillin-N N-acyltransferase-like protein